MRLFGYAGTLRPHWFGVLHALAKGAAELGSRPSPLEGVAVLRRWLPQAEQCAPEYEAWFLRDIAEYLSFSRYRADAEAARCFAQQRSQPWRSEDPSVALSNALVQVNLGQSEQALQILTTTPELAWDPDDSIQQRINETSVWICALEGCGCYADAAVWRERLAHTLQQHGNHCTPWIVRRLAPSALTLVSAAPGE